MEASDNHKKAIDYINRCESLTDDELADAFSFKWFRLNTLYFIKDKSGKKILFTPNQEQEAFYLNQHGRDIILKARQLGFTTFKMISDLDDCLFIDNFSAGCICHNLEDAKDIYRNKIKFAYQSISDEHKEVLAAIGYELPKPINDKDNGYVFDNGSSVRVSTSYRGGTLQSLHVSEFGKICKKYPDKAKEIVTGAFEAVAAGNVITIESTAEGKEGYFYNYCQDAQKLSVANVTPSILEFKFHFFSWYFRNEYAIKGKVSAQLDSYFEKLESKHGIKLTIEQKAWYSAKWKVLGDDMKREYPSTPQEAFEQAIEGAYYAKQFGQIYKEGRICELPDNSHLPVNTYWDIGVGDSTAIWFVRYVGEQPHVIDYYENSGEGLRHYMKVLKDKNYSYGEHWAPHDIDNREFGSDAKSRKQLAKEGYEIDGKKYSLKFDVVPKLSIDNGIDCTREVLPHCAFQVGTTDLGVKALEHYRKEWDEKRNCWKDRPLHDWASHGSDSFRYFAVVHNRRKPAMTISMRTAF